MTRVQTEVAESQPAASQTARRYRVLQRLRESAHRVMLPLQEWWNPIAVYVPGTGAFDKKRQEEAKDLTRFQMDCFNELQGLSSETKERLRPQILFHEYRLAMIDALRQVYAQYKVIHPPSILFFLAWISGVLAGTSWLSGGSSPWAAVLIVCLCLWVAIAAVFAVMLLASVVAQLVKRFAEEYGLSALAAASMGLAVVLYRLGTLASRGTAGILGIALGETSAAWVIALVGSPYLIMIVYEIIKTVRSDGWLKRLSLRFPEIDDLFAVFAVGATVGFPLYQSQLPGTTSAVTILDSAVIGGLFGALVFWVVWGAIYFALVLLSSAIGPYKLLRCPDAVLVDELLWILYAVEREPDWWHRRHVGFLLWQLGEMRAWLDAERPTARAKPHSVEQDPELWEEMRFRQMILTELESGAQAMSRIPRLFSSGDAVTGTLLADKFHMKAGFLRYLKTWVLTPMADTRGVFMRRIAKELVYAADRNWHLLATADETDEKVLEAYKDAKRYRPLLSGLLGTGLKLLVGLIPLGGVWVLQQTSFALDAPVAESLITGAIMVALVNAAQILAPGFGQTALGEKDFKEPLSQAVKSMFSGKGGADSLGRIF